MPAFVLLVLVGLSHPLWADPSSSTHQHSVGMGDGGGDFSSGSGSLPKGGPPPSVGGGGVPRLPPPPPPPPPPVYSPKVIKGNGAGVESKVKALGKPGEVAVERVPRTYPGDYEGGSTQANPEQISIRGPRTPPPAEAGPTGATGTTELNGAPAGF